MAAWNALATLPIEYLRRMRKYPLLFALLPVHGLHDVAVEARRRPDSSILALVGSSVLACGV